MRRKHPLSDLDLLRIAGECREAVGLRQSPWIVASTEVRSPALFGFSVPRLLLPAGLVETSAAQDLRFILMHEFCHVRRRDIALSWVASVLGILYWFNPLVWLIAARMRSDLEMACDALVLSKLAPSESKSYGETIIRLLERFAQHAQNAGLVGILEHREQMRRRVRMISRFGMDSYRLRWAGLAFVVLTAVAALTDARTRHTQLPRAQASNVVLHVLDAETGAPVLGASLDGKIRTDSSGTAALRIIYPWSVFVRAAGYVPQSVAVEDEFALEKTVRMEPAGTIGGVVFSEDGKPIPDVQVSIIKPRPPADPFDEIRSVVKSDAEGRWSFSEMPRDAESLIISLFHPDYGPALYRTGARPLMYSYIPEDRWRTVPLAELRAGRAMLIVSHGFPVAGLVLDPQGKPIEGACLGLSGGPGENRVEVKTGADGRFVFRNASAFRARLDARAEGYLRQGLTLDLSPSMPEITVRMVRERAATLRGRVVDETGQAVAGVMLTGGSVSLTTDENGRFSQEVGLGKPFTVEVRAAGHPVASELVEAGPKENLIRLRSLREIHVIGRVVDSATHRPIPEFQVLISTWGSPMDSMWWNYRKAASGTNGYFNLTLHDSFTPGNPVIQAESNGQNLVRYVVGLKIQAEGYVPDTSQWVAIENGDVAIEVALDRGSPIAGVVRSPDGKAIPGAKVYLIGFSGPQMERPGRLERVFETNLETVTDRSGRFQFEPKRDARGLAAIHESGFALVPVDRLSASEPIILEPWARIEGTLRTNDLLGASEAVVLNGVVHDLMAPVTMPDGQKGIAYLVGLNLRTETDRGGRFSFEKVPSGKVRLSRDLQVGHSHQRYELTKLDVEAGRTYIVSLGGENRSIIGRVVYPGAKETVKWDRLPQALETVMRKPGDLWGSASFECGTDGSFRIENVPPGNYRLRLLVPGFPGSIFHYEVVVPPATPGSADEPFNLGIIVVR